MVQASVKQVNKRGKKNGLHPNSLKNLHAPRWKPGQSGNDSGFSLRSRLKWALSRQLKDGKFEPETVGDELVISMIKGAKLREPTPLIQVCDRVDGKVDDKVTGKIEFVVKWDGNNPQQAQDEST